MSEDVANKFFFITNGNDLPTVHALNFLRPEYSRTCLAH